MAKYDHTIHILQRKITTQISIRSMCYLFLFALVLMIYISILPACQGQPSAEESDRDALIALYNATDGQNWSSNWNWLSNEPVYEWFGVTSEITHGRVTVTKLNLSMNGLNGEIPSELGNLTNLEVLDLGLNKLSGEIPSELGELAKLKILDLKWNELNGEIPPELGNLSNLMNMDLAINQLNSRIPSELSDLTYLTYLSLSGNQLSGQIPPELGNLTNLTDLYLSRNQLSGQIPTRLSHLSNLRTLDLSENQLTGKIPSELGNLENLTEMRTVGNRLSWGVEFEPGIIADRDALVAFYNATDGPNWDENENWLSDRPVGEWFGISTGADGRVATLFLSYNGLKGNIPPELSNLYSLKELNIHGNDLQGIPTEIGNLANLKSLVLSEN